MHPTSVLDIQDERGEHETQKPVALFRELIETYSNPGEYVLDPFAGSGTAGIACIETGRNFLLFEKDTEKYEKASSKLKSQSLKT
jgi:site-specific DNA-methyltransferase (adenine-specific)